MFFLYLNIIEMRIQCAGDLAMSRTIYLSLELIVQVQALTDAGHSNRLIREVER